MLVLVVILSFKMALFIFKDSFRVIVPGDSSKNHAFTALLNHLLKYFTRTVVISSTRDSDHYVPEAADRHLRTDVRRMFPYVLLRHLSQCALMSFRPDGDIFEHVTSSTTALMTTSGIHWTTSQPACQPTKPLRLLKAITLLL